MSTNEFVEQSMHVINRRSRQLPLKPGFSIAVMRRVNADRQRVFHALTVPEYIETWFSVPGSLIGRTFVWRRDELVSISYSCRENEESRIVCSYRVCRKRKLLFTWRHSHALERAPSWVRIRLEGEFRRTAVHVTQFGLELSDRQWHQELWEASLEKMCKLF
jgi:uncharacterized protein YndB with AHSA1/START domain